LDIGDELEGYKLKKLQSTVAIFEKNGKEYTLDLYKPRKKKSAVQAAPKFTQPAPAKVAPKPQSKAAALTPTKDGETTVIPKDLFDRYRRNVRQIQKNINAVPNMVNGQIEGFKVNFIKKGSDFAKLGIQRGDIITAINGEPLTNLKVPIEFFNNLDTMRAATFTIRRGNELKELEYEVR
jgi:type II secretion system protein C